jgi:hypothetical protein
MRRLLDHFALNSEKEDAQKVIDRVDRDVLFEGTNLWILVFAIFIASLGLNVNSTAVVIAAEKDLVSQVCDELKIQYPTVDSCSLSNPTPTADAANKNWTAALTVEKPFSAADRSRLEEWLTKRLGASSVEAVIDLRKSSPANANR